MFLYANNAVALLRTTLTAGATSLQVEIGSGALFPSPSGSDVFALTIEDRRTRTLEIVYVTARAGDTMTIVRAREGTTAKAFAAGAEVSCRITSAMLADLRNQQMVGPDTILANLTPGIAAPTGQPPANILSRFAVFSEGGKGLVPAPGAGVLRMLASDGTWVDADLFVGPPGPAPELGVGNIVHTPYTSPLQVQLRPVADGYLLDMNIPRGQPGVAPTMVGGTATSVPNGTPPDVSIVQISPTSFRVDLSIPDGEQGIVGPMPSLQVGTVTTGEAGSNANIAFTFDGVDTYIADFIVPRGYNGPPPDIITGAVNALPPNSDPTVTISNLGGGLYAINFGIPQGPTGLTGPAPIMQMGTVTTLPPNSPADAQLTPTAPGTYRLDMWLPQGPAGSGTGDMLAANNLSDLTDASLARDHLGLGSAALSSTAAFAPASHVGAGGVAHANATTSTAGFMSATDKSKLNGIADGATANATDAQLRDRTTHTGVQAIATITGLQAALNAKVAGPGVSTNNDVVVFDGLTGDLIKGGGYSIASLLSRANHTGTQAIATVSGLQGELDSKASGSTLAAHIGAGGVAHANATTSTAGFMSATDKSKLNGIADGATANATDAQLRDRTTHTGVQAIATITGLQAALDGKVAGLASATDNALVAFNGTTGKLVKDAGYTTAGLLSRSNHTGTQLISTVSGLQGELDNRPTATAVSAEIAAKAGRYDVVQTLTAAQQGRLRANAGAGVLAGYRNKIINGDFDVWQRGTTQSAIGYGSVDRWYNNVTDGTQVITQQTHINGQEAVPGNPVSFLRATVSGGSATTAVNVVSQIIENVRAFAGGKATLTFYAKADAPKYIATELVQRFGDGGSPPTYAIGVNKILLSTAWARYSFAIDVPSVASKTIGGNTGLGVYFWFSSGTNYNSRNGSLGVQSGTFDISHVSIVEGDATAEADPFEPRHKGVEEALCFRYYQRLFTHFISNGNAGDTVGNQVFFAVPMRQTPSITELAVTENSNTTGVTRSAVNRFGFRYYARTVSAGSSYQTTEIAADAEL